MKHTTLTVDGERGPFPELCRGEKNTRNKQTITIFYVPDVTKDVMISR